MSRFEIRGKRRSHLMPVLACLAFPACAESAFIANQGQWDDAVRFVLRGDEASVFLTETALVFALHAEAPPVDPRHGAAASPAPRRGHAVYLRLAGADISTPDLQARAPLPGRRHYFRGGDPEHWRRNVPAYGEVVYRGLAGGGILRLRAEAGALDYAFSSPAGEPQAAPAFRVEGAGEAGPGLFPTPCGSLRHEPAGEPGRGRLTWTDDPGDRVPAELRWGSYLGGSGSDFPRCLLTLATGEVIVSGETTSDDFPTTPGAYDESAGADFVDAFVSKLSADGSELIWSTYLVGEEEDRAYGIALSAIGDIYIAGSTESADFPVTPGAFDVTHNGETDAFAALLSADGSALLMATFVGGELHDRFYSVAEGAFATLVLVGNSGSADFPTTPGAYDRSFNGNVDGVVCKLDHWGEILHWSTYIGGSDYELA